MKFCLECYKSVEEQPSSFCSPDCENSYVDYDYTIGCDYCIDGCELCNKDEDISSCLKNSFLEVLF